MSVLRKSPVSRHTDGTKDVERSRSNRERDAVLDRLASDQRSSDRHRLERRRSPPDRRRERDRTPDRHRPMTPDRSRFVLLL